MRDAAAVADDEQPFMAGLQILIQLHAHIVKLDLYAIQQGVVIGRTWRDFVQRIDHLDDVVHLTLRDDEAQIAWRGAQGRGDEAVCDAAYGAALTADQIAEALDDDAAAQHVGEPGDAFAILIAVFERLGEMIGHQQREVRVFGIARRIFVAVAVYGDDAVGIFADHHAVRVHAEGPHPVLKLLGAVDDLAFI